MRLGCLEVSTTKQDRNIFMSRLATFGEGNVHEPERVSEDDFVHGKRDIPCSAARLPTRNEHNPFLQSMFVGICQ